MGEWSVAFTFEPKPLASDEKQKGGGRGAFISFLFKGSLQPSTVLLLPQKLSLSLRQCLSTPNVPEQQQRESKQHHDIFGVDSIYNTKPQQIPRIPFFVCFLFFSCSLFNVPTVLLLKLAAAAPAHSSHGFVSAVIERCYLFGCFLLPPLATDPLQYLVLALLKKNKRNVHQSVPQDAKQKHKRTSC